MIVLSDAEVQTGTVFVKSDVFPVPRQVGSYTWVARHPSGWEARGSGKSHLDCVQQVNRELAAELVRSGYTPPSEGTTMIREWVGVPPDEMLTGVEVRRDRL
jgi:hypothetical protein